MFHLEVWRLYQFPSKGTMCSKACIKSKVNEKAMLRNRYKRIALPASDTEWERNTNNKEA